MEIKSFQHYYRGVGEKIKQQLQHMWRKCKHISFTCRFFPKYQKKKINVRDNLFISYRCIESENCCVSVVVFVVVETDIYRISFKKTKSQLTTTTSLKLKVASYSFYYIRRKSFIIYTRIRTSIYMLSRKTFSNGLLSFFQTCSISDQYTANWSILFRILQL